MKKLLKPMALVAALVLLVSALAGCGQETVDTGEATVITVWSTDSHSKAVYDALIAEYNEGEGKEKGIYIDYQVKAGDSLATATDLALQTGDAPELLSGVDLAKHSEEGYLVALEDMPGGEEFLQEYLDLDLIRANNQHQGKTYTVPLYATTRGLVYNKDLFKKVGLVDENGEATPPKTWDEVREYAKILTDANNNQFGIALPMKWSSWFAGDVSAPLWNSVGYEGYDYVTGEYNWDGIATMVDAYLGMKEDGSIYPAPESLDNDTARAYFSEGIIGMKFAFSFDVGVFNDQFPAKCDWGVAPLPSASADEVYKQKMTVSNSYPINAKVLENEDLAKKTMEVIKFFASEEFSAEIYKAGVALPIKPGIAAKTELPADAKKGWKEFAEMVDHSVLVQRQPDLTIELTGKDTMKDIFYSEVWAGNMTTEEYIEKFNQIYAEAMAAYPAEGKAGYKLSDLIVPDWNTKL